MSTRDLPSEVLGCLRPHVSDFDSDNGSEGTGQVLRHIAVRRGGPCERASCRGNAYSVNVGIEVSETHGHALATTRSGKSFRPLPNHTPGNEKASEEKWESLTKKYLPYVLTAACESTRALVSPILPAGNAAPLGLALLIAHITLFYLRAVRSTTKAVQPGPRPSGLPCIHLFLSTLHSCYFCQHQKQRRNGSTGTPPLPPL